MKRLQLPALVLLGLVAIMGCKNVDFKKTSSGVMYKIFDGGSKDSTKVGSILKMNQAVRLSGSKDTLLGQTYGEMPFFAPVRDLSSMMPNQPMYDPSEIYHLLKKGDSAVVVLYVDSLIKKGMAQEAQLPPFFKKGDKITFTFKVLDVFKSDSLARIDYQKEGEAYQQRMIEKQKADSIAFEKSGGKEKQIAEMEAYLKKKNISATKTEKGTFVKVDNPGDGASIVDGKFVTVSYDGKHLLTDSSFQKSSITVPVGQGGSIRGFEDGLRLFKKGGKGVIYIPGYLAYGKNPPPNSPFKENEPLLFEVEITGVSETPPQEQMMQPPAPQQVAPQPEVKK